MTAYDSVKEKLLSLSIYNIESDGLIEAEIRAYAEGLQVLYDAVDDIIKESFIQTAEGRGLTELESMTRTYAEGDTLAERRKKLMLMLSIKPTDIGDTAIKKGVAAMGLECNITEDSQRSHLYINILDDVASSKQSFIEKEAKRFAPSYFINYVTFGEDNT